MFAITGITGRVGGQLARELRGAGRAVRAVLRDAAKAVEWTARGCEVAVAAMDDATALTRAFAGVEAVFVLLPPTYDPTPGFAETRRFTDAIATALRAAKVGRVVCLSTIGAEATQENVLTQLRLLEQALTGLPAVTFLRAGWFVENIAWDLAHVRATGEMPSFLQPLERPIAMVGTADVAHAAAALLQEPFEGRRVVELEGPARVSPLALAAALSRALGRDVAAQAIPRAEWEGLFRAQGMRHPVPRMRMLDGFNEGWIDFDPHSPALRRGVTTAQAVIDGLVSGAPF